MSAHDGIGADAILARRQHLAEQPSQRRLVTLTKERLEMDGEACGHQDSGPRDRVERYPRELVGRTAVSCGEHQTCGATGQQDGVQTGRKQGRCGPYGNVRPRVRDWAAGIAIRHEGIRRLRRTAGEDEHHDRPPKAGCDEADSEEQRERSLS